MRAVLTVVAALALAGCVAVVPLPRGEQRVQAVPVEPDTP